MDDRTISVAVFCRYEHGPLVQDRLPVRCATAFYGVRDEQRVLTATLPRAAWLPFLAALVSLGLEQWLLEVRLWDGDAIPQELLPPGNPDDPELPSCETRVLGRYRFWAS